jgi:hypothetical protein
MNNVLELNSISNDQVEVHQRLRAVEPGHAGLARTLD